MRVLRLFAGVAFLLAAPAGRTQNTAVPPAGTLKIAPGIVDAAAARKLVAQGIKVVDVRTPSEYASGHLPGAVNIPYDEIGQRATELGPPTTPLLLYCKSGGRSGKAVKTLREKGFTQLYDLQSYDAWVRSEPEKN